MPTSQPDDSGWRDRARSNRVGRGAPLRINITNTYRRLRYSRTTPKPPLVALCRRSEPHTLLSLASLPR